jgi:hypothetical protein
MEYLYIQLDQMFRLNFCHGAFIPAPLPQRMSGPPNRSSARQRYCLKADIAATRSGCNKRCLTRSQMTF